MRYGERQSRLLSVTLNSGIYDNRQPPQLAWTISKHPRDIEHHAMREEIIGGARGCKALLRRLISKTEE
tara:strand:- start:182 stop:388 length:207 start_codon:yes stop_codon:yes gene_type:complete